MYKRQQFITDLDQFDELCRQRWNTGFANLSAPDKQAAMSACVQNGAPFAELPGNFFYKLKALTILGYYSSEAGASQELVYLPIPGGYSGDFSVSDNGGRAFSPPVL